MSCRHYSVPSNPEKTGKSRYCNECQMMVDHYYYGSEKDRIYVHGDSMNPLLNHADGKIYDSKSSFRRATHNAGYKEVGNDELPVNRGIQGDFNIRNELRESIQRHLN